MFLKYVIHLFQDDYTRNKKSQRTLKRSALCPLTRLQVYRLKLKKCCYLMNKIISYNLLPLQYIIF